MSNAFVVLLLASVCACNAATWTAFSAVSNTANEVEATWEFNDADKTLIIGNSYAAPCIIGLSGTAQKIGWSILGGCGGATVSGGTRFYRFRAVEYEISTGLAFHVWQVTVDANAYAQEGTVSVISIYAPTTTGTLSFTTTLTYGSGRTSYKLGDSFPFTVTASYCSYYVLSFYGASMTHATLPTYALTGTHLPAPATGTCGYTATINALFVPLSWLNTYSLPPNYIKLHVSSRVNPFTKKRAEKVEAFTVENVGIVNLNNGEAAPEAVVGAANVPVVALVASVGTALLSSATVVALVVYIKRLTASATRISA